jgi:hypothetical protein
MQVQALTTRKLASAGAAVALFAGILATVTTSSPARAEVDPKGANARFISLTKTQECATLGYTAEGYLVDDSGKKIPNSTWKTWDGNIRGCGLDTDKTVFAWEPANDHARIDLTIYSGKNSIYTKTVPGDKNYCLHRNGSKGENDRWAENWSSEGGGGSGSCTAG